MKISLKRKISIFLIAVMVHSLVMPPASAAVRNGPALHNPAVSGEDSQKTGTSSNADQKPAASGKDSQKPGSPSNIIRKPSASEKDHPEPGSPSNASLLSVSQDDLVREMAELPTGNGNLEITGNAVKWPGVFEYGTPLEDIIDLDELYATLDGKEVEGNFELLDSSNSSIDMDKCYDAGEQTIKVKFSDEKNEHTKTESFKFTIVPVVLNSFDNESSMYIKYEYWMQLRANEEKNKTEQALMDCLRKEYIAYYGNGKEVKLTAAWSLDDSSPNFEPKGYVDDIWYSCTAHLTLPSSEKPGNFEINTEPKGHIRVIPVSAYQTLTSESKVMTKEEINSLTTDDIGLPTMAEITYLPKKRKTNQWTIGLQEHYQWRRIHSLRSF